MNIDAKTVMALRKKTGAGMMECKKALVENDGDMQKAQDALRAKLGKKAQKRAGRATKEGVIGVYKHHDHKLVALVELQCETDFVARNESFQDLATKMAMHVAAVSPSPQYMTASEVPEEILARERAIYTEQVADKPEQIRGKIVDGKVASFLKERCLMNQPYAMDANAGTVEEVLKAAVAKLGENIQIARYHRMKLGDGGDE